MALRDWLPRKSIQQANSNQQASSTPSFDEGDEDTNRLAARLALETLKPLTTISLEIVGSISRWLLASLLTVNAGAVVALISNAEKIAVGLFYPALVCFLTGLIAAFSIGLRSLANANGALSWLGELIGYWSSVEADGLRSSKIEASLDVKREANERDVRKLTDVGKLGLSAFLVGVVLAAIGAQQ